MYNSIKMTTSIDQSVYGQTVDGGECVVQYTLTNTNGMVLKVINFGAAITHIDVPDVNGHIADVVLGYDNLKGYEENPCYFGVTVGRVANRTAGGQFSIDGQAYQVSVNEIARGNNLHGGWKGFSKVVWKGEVKGDMVVMSYVSPDDQQGFPGDLTVQCTYQLTEDDAVVIQYHATTTKATPVNLCNHSYFNLAGQGVSPVLDHLVTIAADEYTPVNDRLIPTGIISAVKDTVFDLREATVIADKVNDVAGGGYDHNFCLKSNSLSDCSVRVSHKSGRVLQVYTTQPGVQFYTANFLDGTVAGKAGVCYGKHGGFCLETQNYPNAVNMPSFPDAVLHPGQEYHHTTIYKFSWK